MAADILRLALAFYRSPLRFPELLRGQFELPPGADLVLRTASGDLTAVNPLVSPALTAEELRRAALFFVEQAFFAQRANHYRVLGLTPRASPEQIKEHYRLLMHLFHPDRQERQQSWTDGYAKRINQAYRLLHNPEARRTYDATLGSAAAEGAAREWSVHAVIAGFSVQPSGSPRFRRVRRRTTTQFRRAAPAVLRTLGATLLAGLIIGGALLHYQNRPSVRLEPALSGLPATAASGVSASSAGPEFIADYPDPEWSGMLAAVAPAFSLESRQAQDPPVNPGKAPPKATLGTVPSLERAKSDEHPEPPGNIPPTPTKPPAAGATTSAVNSVPAGAANRRLSVPVPTATALAGESSSAISPPELNALIMAFKQAYDSGDLNTLMALFGAHLPASDHRYIDRIRAQYHQLFQRTTARQLTITGLHWRRLGKTASGEGQLFLAVRDRNRQWRHGYTGRIGFTVVKDNGQLTIQQLDYVLAELDSETLDNAIQP